MGEGSHGDEVDREEARRSCDETHQWRKPVHHPVLETTDVGEIMRGRFGSTGPFSER